MSSKDFKVTLANALLPVVLVSFTVFLMLAFQMTQVMRDREMLHQARMQQEKPLEEAQKLQTQLSALALGTKKLADGGDKSAQIIIAQLKQAGITVGAETAPAAGTTAAPKMAAPAPESLPVSPKSATDQP